MTATKLFRRTFTAQSLYLIITGLWPLVSIQTFMAVTGPKNDIWLVKTVGLLALAMGITMLVGLYENKIARPAVLLALTSATAFACIDFYYYSEKVIPVIYVYDGIVQLFFMVIYFYCIRNRRPENQRQQ